MIAPAVSVLMPVRDTEATVAEAVGSIRGQTFTDWEMVAVDDGSRDGTTSILRELAANDPRIRVVSRARDGLVAALNHGLCDCRAPLVARMDADDVSLPRRLEFQVALMAERLDLAVAGCLVECFPGEALTEGMRHYETWLNGLITPEEIERDIFIESPLAHPSVIFRRGAIAALGGYRDGDFPEDYDLWLRLHGAGLRMAKTPEVLVLWRDGGKRLSRTDPRYSPAAFRTIKARHLAMTFLAGRSEVGVWGAGPDGRAWRKALAEVGIGVARYFDVDPRKVGRKVAGVAPILDWRELASHRGLPLLVAVGVKGARELIRAELYRLGMVERVDFVCVQ